MSTPPGVALVNYLDKNTFSNPDVIAYISKHFYPVKFNAEGKDPITYKGFTYTNPNYREAKRGRNATHFFADALRLQGYPSLAFFESDGTLNPVYSRVSNSSRVRAVFKNDCYRSIQGNYYKS